MSDEKLDYHQYIASFQWKRKSEEALKRAAYVCENCGKEEEEISLNTHHLSYNDLCNEKPEDLIVLCEDCHYSVHNNGLKPNRNFGNYHINIKHERWIYSDLTPVEYDEGMEKYEKYLEKVKRQQENIKLADMYRRKRAISKLVFWLAVTLVILIGIILTKSIVF